MRVIGLTGGIGTGKSTVAGWLADQGVPVIDADRVAREVVAPGTPGLAAIVEAFGTGVVDAAGALDRPAMRRRISEDPRARKTLEGITHPAIAAAIAAQLRDLAAEGHAVAVVEAALMVETGSYRLYDGVIVVSAPPEVQLARVVSRDGVSEEEARALMAAQLPLAHKEAVATWVIRNDGSLHALRDRTEEVWQAIRSRTP